MFAVPMTVKMSMLVFFIVTTCGLVGRCHRFEEHIASIVRAEDGPLTVHPSEGDSSNFMAGHTILVAGSLCKSM
jgi:hypothetical protein